MGARRAGRGGNAQHCWPMTQPRQRYQCSADEAGHTPCVSRNGGATDALTRELSLAEQRYITAARAPNTLRGYRSDWAEFTT